MDIGKKALGTVTFGWIDAGETAGEFAHAVALAAAYETSQQRFHGIIRFRHGPQMPEGRNLVVEHFMAGSSEWLLMLDTDMVFQYRDVERILESADRDNAPIVGGLCFGVNDRYGQFPTMYRRIGQIPTVMLDEDLSEGKMVEVDGTGCAFLLVHRRVFEATERPFSVHKWFHRLEISPSGDFPGGYLGEDLSWCWWARDRGFPIYVNTGIRIGHIKPTTVGFETYRKKIVDG